MNRLLLLTPLILATALLASGCLWGVVTDRDTGAPIPGANVHYWEGPNDKVSVTTNSLGIYAFDIATGRVPWSRERVELYCDAPGYLSVAHSFPADYLDNPDASLDNLSSYWEIYHMDLSPGLELEVELLSVDIERARKVKGCLPSPRYRVTFSAGEPGVVWPWRCERDSDWFSTCSTDPPPETLDLNCQDESEDVEIGVTVEFRRPAAYVGSLPETDISTAVHEVSVADLWADDPSAWQYETLNSSDLYGPDDEVLQFTAEIRFRAVWGLTE